jgi:hypothetical protein
VAIVIPIAPTTLAAYIAYAAFKTFIYSRGKLPSSSNSAFAKTPFKA